MDAKTVLRFVQSVQFVVICEYQNQCFPGVARVLRSPEARKQAPAPPYLPPSSSPGHGARHRRRRARSIRLRRYRSWSCPAPSWSASAGLANPATSPSAQSSSKMRLYSSTLRPMSRRILRSKGRTITWEPWSGMTTVRPSALRKVLWLPFCRTQWKPAALATLRNFR